MAIITLTTDFGLKDPFVAIIKASIYAELPEVKIVDISHEISPFNIHQAAYVLINSYKHFPKNTIHIIGVDAEQTPKKNHIIAKVNDHYFVGSNNGVLSLIAGETRLDEIIEVNFDRYHKAGLFPTNEVFVKIACHIARGGKIGILGRKIKAYHELSEIRPVIKNNTIITNVIYIDNFGNVVTNLKKEQFNDVGKGKKFEILLPRNYRFTQIYDRYSDIEKNDFGDPVHHGTGMVLFNSCSFLEIAVYKSNPDTVGGASTLFGLNYRDTVTVNFL